MTVQTISQPPFVVDSESERNSSWPDNSFVFCKDTGKLYQLEAGVWVLMNNKINYVAGTITRPAATASGTQVITIGFNPGYVMFSAVDDGDATVGSDGRDDGVIATCQYTNSKNFLITLLGALGLASNVSIDQTRSINVVNNSGAGHIGYITAKSSTGYTITWTKAGAGRAITIKYLAIQ